MAVADIPLTGSVVAAIQRHWGITFNPAASRLPGGEESAAYHDGSYVVRVGPRWRRDDSIEWCHAVAAAAARSVPEALAPLPVAARPDRTAVRVDGRPVSVWRWVRGERGDERDPAQRAQAAQLLARMHHALRGVDPGPRPVAASPTTDVPDLADPELDAWLASFDLRYGQPGRVQPLHGDYYAGNMLAAEGRLVAVFDWDEAFVGPPERELAWAAWEWGDVLWTLDLTPARGFIDAYVTAGGPAEPIDERALCQLIRQRVRAEIAYSRAVVNPDEPLAPDDAAYDAQQLKAFAQLRP